MNAINAEPDRVAASMRLSAWQRPFEIARPWVLIGTYAFACWHHWWLAAVVVALACYLAAFVQSHDAMHNALGLSRVANDLLLAGSGLLLLKSGHALRVTHLRHHGRCLDASDPEGLVAHWPLSRVLWAGPFHILGLRVRAMRLAPRTAREQSLETVFTVVLLSVATWLAWKFHSPAGVIYWGVAAAMSSTMALWAAYLPHHLSPQHWLVRFAAASSRGWTPVVNSLAYHLLHHRFPRVPTALLPALARAIGPDAAFAEEITATLITR